MNHFLLCFGVGVGLEIGMSFQQLSRLIYEGELSTPLREDMCTSPKILHTNQLNVPAIAFLYVSYYLGTEKLICIETEQRTRKRKPRPRHFKHNR